MDNLEKLKQLKVGSVVWLRDENRRRYAPEKDCFGSGPIEREHYFQAEIEAETRFFFYFDKQKRFYRIDKRTGEFDSNSNYGNLSGYWLTEEEIDQLAWVQSNRYKIVDRIKYCNDYQLLNQIADLIGYDESGQQ